MMQTVSIFTLTSTREHLLLTAPNKTIFSRLKAMTTQSDFHIGLISDHLPLLANLSAMENIALGCMYHHNMSLKACRDKMARAIACLDLESVMDQRRDFLTRTQRLKVQLLRCVANGSAFIVLESPPSAACGILEHALTLLDENVFLWVCCLSTEQDVYTSLGYTTIDLSSFS